MKRFCAILIAAFLPALTAADENKIVELTVKPLLCIVDQRTPSCDMSFRILWRSAERGYYCVLNSLDEEPLHCWSEQRRGEVKDERSAREDFSYSINQGDGEQPIETVTVQIVRVDSDDRRRRRRSRHVWDLL
ncbi:MAG: DUF3019 domain-containing protein [Pseudomonadota bacterium]